MAQWVYGRNSVKSLLEGKDKVKELFVMDSLRKDELALKAAASGIKMTYVPKSELKKITGTEKHQGFAAKIEDYKLYSLNDLIESCESRYPLIVLLDGLEDPHNLGAILRSAEAVGADGIVYARNRSVSLNPTVAKVSTGAIDNVKVAEVTNLGNAIETLKKNGYWIVGAADRDSQDYRSIDYCCPIGLVIGSEGRGISRLVMEKCDYRAGLPMRGKINSLNASVAAGIFLYAIDSCRNPLPGGKENGKRFKK